MDPNLGSQAKSIIHNKLIGEQIVRSSDLGLAGDPLLAKTRKIIYLIGSLGFVLCRSSRFCT
jgi:hypothetical protein